MGGELRTRLSLVTPQVEDRVTDQQSQKLRKNVSLREFYPRERDVVKDMRNDNTWWPGAIAERTAPKSYVIVLNDNQVWQ